MTSTDSACYFSLPTPPIKPSDTPRHNGLKHAPAAKSLKKANKRLCSVKFVRISSPKPDSEWFFPAYLHLPQNYRREADERREKTAVILMSGASGGVAGPSSIYISMADKIASLRRGIPVLRMDYRYPAGAVRRLDDALLAVFGSRYLTLHGNAHRQAALRTRLEKLRGAQSG